MAFPMTFDEAVAYISGRAAFGQRTHRERLVALLERLDNPHHKLRCVHVAGTNGKGSTTTFIASVLQAAGYRTGAYLSPYVFDLRERVQVNGQLIPKTDFAMQVATLRPHVEAIAAQGLGQLTEFELKTALALNYFAEQATDFAVIEVGIGGRLDATNVIPPPLVAVIVSIGWDHMNLLGDTLGKIAFEKAGIFKPGTIGVTAVPPGEALTVIEQVALEKQVPLYRVIPAGADESDGFVTYHRNSDRTLDLSLPNAKHTVLGAVLAHPGQAHKPPSPLNGRGAVGEGEMSDRSLSGLRLQMRGAYQAENAATAAATLEVLRRFRDVTIPDSALRSGLENATLPGRFQVIKSAPERATLLLDGAHNEDGARTLLEALQAEFDHLGGTRRFPFVIGMSKNHDPLPYLTVLSPVIERLIATAPPFKPRPVEDIVEAANRLHLPVEISLPASEAISNTVLRANPEEIVVVTGSFYTVGETPEFLRTKLRETQ